MDTCSNTLYLVGSNRISSELHNPSEDTNAALLRPLKLDCEMNDPATWSSSTTPVTTVPARTALVG